MKNTLILASALMLAMMIAAPQAHALDLNNSPAFQQLQQADDHGQQAVRASSNDEAKNQSNQVFDTPASTNTARGNDNSNTNNSNDDDDN